MKLSRRRFLTAAGAAALAAAGGSWIWKVARPPRRSAIGGAIVGASHALGHRLRAGEFPAPSLRRKASVVIAGGGVAGLAGAWKLRRSGIEDLLVLDLEPEAGGTSRGGRNAVSAYPWGAHYLPLPGRDATAVRQLLEEMGVIEGWTPGGDPRYDERSLCFAPQERLYLHGRWQEGLFPELGATASDLAQRAAFRGAMAGFRERRGPGGRRAFAIPVAASAEDPDLSALDRLSMADWMDSRGWTSPRLRWYVDYCCRDDFGSSAGETSAWAGLHYFASREDAEVLTWPEGNARLAAALGKGLSDRVITGALVHRIEETRGGVEVDYLEAATGRVVRLDASQVVVATPQFITRRIVAGLGGTGEGFEYSPWMVANLTLDRVPAIGRRDAPLSWDNVLYDSPSLGYVMATHQSLATAPGPVVMTYYRPFAGEPPAAARAQMLATPWEGWRDQILADLSRAHPDLEGLVSRVDVMLWGHGMVKPRPGFLSGDARTRAAASLGRIHPAHSDLSGMALFEEAQYRGVLAAERVLRALGTRFETSLGPWGEAP